MVTEELIKNQRDEAKQVDAKYTVLVSGAGVTCEEKPILEALLPGVRLHFLRYALFPKEGKGKASAMRIKDYKDEEFTLSDADISNGDLNSTDFFMVGASIPREGYIYLINPDDNTDCHELKVNADGNMSHVIWDNDNFYNHNKQPKDERLPENDNIYYKRIINKEKGKARSFWIGYSPVQWAYKHFKKVLKMSDDEKKALHMIYVEAKGIKKGEETAQEHVLPYNKVHFVYDREDSRHRAFKERLKKVAAIEKRESNKGKNDILEDMFITLHDPIGAVEDIAFELNDAFSKQEAIVEAIQNGEDYETVIDRYKNGTEKTSFTYEEQQLQSLFQTALTTYHLVYGNPKMESDYDGGGTSYWNTDFKGSGVDKTKVEHILGVAYRKERRKEIRTLRNELGGIMHTNYYKNAWQHYNTEVDDYILEGKFLATNHMALLAKKPHSVDRHLDLKKNFEDNDDKWEEFFSETLDFDHDKPLNKLLDTPVELVFVTGPLIDLENKLGGVIRGLTESYAEKIIVTEQVTTVEKVQVPKTRIETKTVKVPEYKDILFKRLLAHKVYGVEVLEVREKTLEAEFKGTNYELDRQRVNFIDYKPIKKKHKTSWRIDNEGKILIARLEVSKEVVLKQKLRGKNLVQVPVIHNKTVEEVVHYLDEIERSFTKQVDKEIFKRPHGELAKNLFDGKIFTGSLAVLQVFNVLNAASAIGNTNDYKNIVNTVGITAELIEASLYYKRSIAINNGISKNMINKLSYRANTFGNFGAGVTVLMCAWEALDSQNARDYDAMWAWAGAGAAWGAFSFGGSTMATGLASLGFTPAGIVIGGIAIGLTALAYYLKDTPLEAYFINNILSDAVAAPNGASGNLPWEYAKKLYTDRDNQIPEPSSIEFWAKDEFKKWENMQVMYQDFLDILVCANIRFTPTELILKKNIRPWASTISVSIDISDIVAYRAEISFRQFLTTEDQLDYEVYYFENGSDITPVKIEPESETIIIDKTKGQIPKAIIDFKVNKNDLKNNNSGAHIVFVCRLKLEENKYYPIDIKDEKRYIGARFTTQEEVRNVQKGLFNKKTIKDSDYQGPVAIDTLSKLLSKEAWKDKPFKKKVND